MRARSWNAATERDIPGYAESGTNPEDLPDGREDAPYARCLQCGARGYLNERGFCCDECETEAKAEADVDAEWDRLPEPDLGDENE